MYTDWLSLNSLGLHMDPNRCCHIILTAIEIFTYIVSEVKMQFYPEFLYQAALTMDARGYGGSHVLRKTVVTRMADLSLAGKPHILYLY